VKSLAGSEILNRLEHRMPSYKGCFLTQSKICGGQCVLSAVRRYWLQETACHISHLFPAYLGSDHAKLKCGDNMMNETKYKGGTE